MRYFLLALISFGASLLTLFSGFGLGTILLPAFLVFFPMEVAIALTAIVHLANNVFKLALMGRFADWQIVQKFGIPSILAAFVGAWCLSWLAEMPTLGTMVLFEHTFSISLLKVVIGVLIIVFALVDLVPKWANAQFPARYLPIGGLLSGFFGGLSGHQGMLRSAFLVKSNLEKQAFVGTGVVIACFIDVTRLSVYAFHLTKMPTLPFDLLLVAIFCAFMGAYLGSRLLEKVTLKQVQRLVGVSLIFFGALMILGVI